MADKWPTQMVDLGWVVGYSGSSRSLASARLRQVVPDLGLRHVVDVQQDGTTVVVPPGVGCKLAAPEAPTYQAMRVPQAVWLFRV